MGFGLAGFLALGDKPNPMKFTHTLTLLLLLAGCSSKPTTERSSADSTKAIVADSVTVQPADTIKTKKQEPAKKPIVEAKQVPGDPNKKTLRCKFTGLGGEACATFIFDCLEFDGAETAALPTEQSKLWNSLMVFPENGEGDFVVANTNYVGKTFEIVHNYTQGQTCAISLKGGAEKVRVPNLISFKQVK